MKGRREIKAALEPLLLLRMKGEPVSCARGFVFKLYNCSVRKTFDGVLFLLPGLSLLQTCLTWVFCPFFFSYRDNSKLLATEVENETFSRSGRGLRATLAIGTWV